MRVAIEDLPSGLTLRLVATQDGGARLIVTGRSLPGGRCEVVFDSQGRPLK